jgi:nifR3 family TIM-barrel protein
MSNFWIRLPKPFFALAPMADVTDPAFRRIIVKYGKPDIVWTEFVSADGLCHVSGREALIKDLAYTEDERPIVAQLFSSNPANMRVAAKLCAELGFDGIDINMGCPDKTIEKQGCGAAMIKTPEIASVIIQAVKDGIRDAGKEIPVSVKTRIGYYKNEIETWIPFLLSQHISALTVHLRTRKEMSDVPAHWEYMSRIVEIKNAVSPQTLVLGNGDIVDMHDAREKAYTAGCDGIMLGRAIFGNPWLFNKDSFKTMSLKNTNNFLLKIFSAHAGRVAQRFLNSLFFRFGIIKKDRYWLRNQSDVSLFEKLHVIVEHAQLFEELLPHKNFSIMKKHFKAYVNGFSGAKELRMQLMNTTNTAEIREIVDNFLAE